MKYITISRRVAEDIISKIKTKITRSIKKIKTYLKKASTLSLIVKIATFSLAMAMIPAGTMKLSANEANKIAPYNSEISLDTASYNAVKLPEEAKPVITIGESNDQRIAREEQEAKELAMASSRTTVVRERTSYSAPVDADLATKRALAKKAAATFGIDWKILEAVWQVESGKAWITPVKSYAGAQGPMQFMSGTWNKYAYDGNGDGITDINNAEDAVYAGASLLAQAGAAWGDVESALLSYNHAQWYVEKVKAVANSIVD